MGSSEVSNGSRDWKKYLGTLQMGGLRLREKVCPTAANINLTKPQLLNREGGQVACRAATKISAKSMP